MREDNWFTGMFEEIVATPFIVDTYHRASQFETTPISLVAPIAPDNSVQVPIGHVCYIGDRYWMTRQNWRATNVEMIAYQSQASSRPDEWPGVIYFPLRPLRSQ